MSILDKLGLTGIDSAYIMTLESLTEKNTKGKGIHPYGFGDKMNPVKEEKKFMKAKEQRLKEGHTNWIHYNYDKFTNEYFYI